jgi:flagellar assembly factor FliW
MTAAAPLSTGATRLVESSLLGRFAVEEERVFEFPDGLPGFPTCRQWILVDAGHPGCAWLQAVTESLVTFFVLDPFRAVPGYTLDIPDEQLSRLGALSAESIAVLGVVTLPRSAEEPATINLQGPLILDVHTRRGAQLVLAESTLGLRHPVDLGSIG